MTVSLRHAFASTKGDGPDATKVRPSNWNAEHVLNMSGGYLLGRQTPGEGPVEEITAIRVLPNGNVGIGTASPGARLDVAGYTKLGNYGGTFQGVTIANNAASSAAFGAAFIDFHNEIGTAIANVFGGIETDGSSFVEIATTPAGSRSSDRRVARVRVTGSGKTLVGVTDNGGFNLQCNGTGVWGAGAYVNGSDERIKDDIAPIGSCLDVVNSLNPVTFRYTASWSTDQAIQPGFIAQELLQALADKSYVGGVVQQGPEYYSVAYQALIPLLTKALQEASAKIDALTTRVAALEATQ